MSLNIKRIQLTENGVAQDVDILTSAECVTFEDGVNLQDKYDNGDIASADVLGDLTDVVGILNELNTSARENEELISELANRPPLTSALRKEVASGEWGSVSTLPYGLYEGGTAVVYNDEIHILGGDNNNYNGLDSEQSHYKFSNSSWSSVGTLPYVFYCGCSIVYNDEIHILGSYDRTYGNGYNKHYKYNGSIWESVSTLPYKFSDGCAVVLNDEIHIMGSSSESPSTQHYKYNGTIWESVSTLPYNFCYGGTVVFNNEIHILGGYTSNSTGRTQHRKYNGSSWEIVSTLPYALFKGSAIIYNNEMHILGDYNNATAHYKYNGTSWESVSTINKFAYGSVVIYDKEIHLLGGIYGSTNHYSAKFGTYLTGYSKADTEIYLPISTTPCTSNLVATDDGYTVTEDGYVEVLLNE